MDLPEQIKRLVGRCEVEALWNRLARLADYYEKTSGNFMPGDVRANCFADAAKDLREIQDSVIREMKKNG